MRRLFGVLLVLMAPLVVSANGDDVQKELAALQGKWMVVALEVDGEPFPKESIPKFLFHVRADGQATGRMEEIEYQAKVSVDPTKAPKTINNAHQTGEHKGKTQFGIYKIEAGKWIVCMTAAGAAESDRPKTFATKDTEYVLFTFERVKENDKP